MYPVKGAQEKSFRPGGGVLRGAAQVARRVLRRCVKTCEMEEEPRRPAILCRDRPLMNKRVYYALRRRFEASGVNVICGDLGGN